MELLSIRKGNNPDNIGQTIWTTTTSTKRRKRKLPTIIISFSQLSSLLPSRFLIVIIAVQMLLAARVSCIINLDRCRDALGMEGGRIQDSQISASSSFDSISVGEHNARIRTETNGGAWCPKGQINETSKEWIQIDLGQTHLITAVETQGRFGAGHGVEYAPGYKIHYWRPGLNKWAAYSNPNGNQVLKGNENTNTPILRELDSPIVASKIRLVPWSPAVRTVCLRMELYGCPFKENLQAYSIPDGVKKSTALMNDWAYDGVRNSNNKTLTEGLGILFDGVIGDDYHHANNDHKWVGWKAAAGLTVTIEMELDAVRSVESVSLHCSNQFKIGARVFRSAHVYFSRNGISYSKRFIDFTFIEDTQNDRSRWVKIPIPNRQARFIRIQFLPAASKWLLISEIKIESREWINNNSSQVEEENTMMGVEFTGKREIHRKTITMFTLDDMPPQYLALIIGISVFIISICSLVIILVYMRHRKIHQETLAVYSAAYSGISSLARPVNHPNNNGKNVHIYINPEDESSKQQFSGLRSAYSLNNAENSLIERQQHQNNNNQLPLHQHPFPKRPLPVSPPPAYQTEGSDSSEYAEPEIVMMDSQSDIPLLPSTSSAHQYKTDSEASQSHYASSDVTSSLALHKHIIDTLNRQTNSRSKYSLVEISDLPSTSSAGGVAEIPRHRLHFQQKLGEGQFGEVHLCQLQTPNGGYSVAVKMLRKAADRSVREDFEKEMKVLSMLDDENVVGLVGVCSREEPMAMVLEYMSQGDLHTYLNSHACSLQTEDLESICEEIASGMKYLENLNFVHRDLATRNCLVSAERHIKIADFGLARSLYSNDYYRIEGKFVLPIRWMAWESILLGKFSCATDVWSFGVTIWEVMTRAVEQPFAQMNDQQIVQNLQNIQMDSPVKEYLPRPANCPTEMYDLMMECWRVNESERPKFKDIYQFLNKFIQ